MQHVKCAQNEDELAASKIEVKLASIKRAARIYCKENDPFKAEQARVAAAEDAKRDQEASRRASAKAKIEAVQAAVASPTSPVKPEGRPPVRTDLW